jgi:hypothetical protein
VTNTEQPRLEGQASLAMNGRSVDDRLDALLETIRTWDWRTARDDRGAPAADVATAIAPPQTATVPNEIREATDRPQLDPSLDTAGPPATEVPDQIDVDEPPATGPERVRVDGATQPVKVEPVRDTGITPEEPARYESEDAAAAWFDDVAELKPEPHAIRQLWSRRWVRIVAVCLAVAVPVVLIIGAIRVTTNSSPSAPPATTAGPASNASSSSHHRSPHVAPIDSAQLTQYKAYAESLRTANVSVDQGLVNAGSTPTEAVLAPVVASYLSALDLYRLRVHSMQWPASLQTDVTIDEAQLKTLTDLLVFLPAANPATLNVWLSQLHHDASIVQDTDNQVRHDLGLPALSSFPT